MKLYGSSQVFFTFFFTAVSASLIGSPHHKEQLIPRSEQSIADTWDLTCMYKSFPDWDRECRLEMSYDYDALFKPYREAPRLSSHQLRELLDLYLRHERNLAKLGTWAHLNADQDTAHDAARQAQQVIQVRFHVFSEASSWIEPTILSIPLAELEQMVCSEELSCYKILLQRLIRRKEHTLPIEQESLLALSQRALCASQQAFSSINNADFRFPDIEDEQHVRHSLSHASYSVYMRSPDRTCRKNAFEALHNRYHEYENTLADLLNGQIQGHLFEAKARKYASCLESALWTDAIPTSVYHALIDTVRANVSVLHRYMQLKKRALGVDQLYPWDLQVPLVKEKIPTYTYDEAVELVRAACRPLGSHYVEQLTNGLTFDRWVDKYENKNKRSGAYSSGCYDSNPYILMNYKGILRDVFTLCHETGHSMHSYYSKTQPYHYSNYPIFVAEVASTFNEELLFHELLQRCGQDKELRASILNSKLDDLVGTLFRQTLFAEFELFVHERAERGEPITPRILNDKYLELIKYYYGEAVTPHELLASEWARIPHFYYNYYVYQYATGISAAHALASQVVHGSEKDAEHYVGFLKSGGSQFPIDLLRSVGVDMTSGRPVEQTIAYFGELLDQFEDHFAQTTLVRRS